jgi:hypothetical protein
MTIIGAGQLSEEEIALKLTEGYRLVSYEYCLSFIVVTLKRPTSLYLLPPNDSDFGNRTLFSCLSFFIGWWGIPWGPIYTISTIYRNLSGGHDHSQTLIDRVLASGPSSPPPLSSAVPGAEHADKAPGIAVAALILGLLSVPLTGPLTAIPAIICGHIALIRIKKDGLRKGRGLALTGLIIGYVVVLFYAFLIFQLLRGLDDSTP